MNSLASRVFTKSLRFFSYTALRQIRGSFHLGLVISQWLISLLSKLSPTMLGVGFSCWSFYFQTHCSAVRTFLTVFVFVLECAGVHLYNMNQCRCLSAILAYSVSYDLVLACMAFVLPTFGKAEDDYRALCEEPYDQKQDIRNTVRLFTQDHDELTDCFGRVSSRSLAECFECVPVEPPEAAAEVIPQSPGLVFADDADLFHEFIRQGEAQITGKDIERLCSDERCHTITIQVDTRPPGILDTKNVHSPLNASAKYMWRATKYQATQIGLYLFFDASAGAFSSFSMYWLGPVILAYLSVVFPRCRLILLDGDAVVCMDEMENSLKKDSTVAKDCFVTASDSASPINAGFVYLRFASTRNFVLQDFEYGEWFQLLKNILKKCRFFGDPLPTALLLSLGSKEQLM